MALRTNAVFVFIFLFLDLALYLLAAAYWTLAEGNTALGGQLEVVSGIDISDSVRVLMCPVGCWRMRIHFLHGRLVSACCATHASSRFPTLTPCGRLEHKIQRRGGKTKGKGRYREARIMPEHIYTAILQVC